MSRIGKSALAVPTGVEVTIAGAAVTVKGPKGTLKRELPVGVSARREENNLFVERANDERDSRSRHGLARTLLSNMIIGVTDGYSKALDIQGVGYRAEAQGPNKLKLALGYSHPIVYTAPEGVTFEVTAQTQIVIKGSEPEPYKGKGVRYLNERVRRKAGKTGKK
jgi:large subunit ribosomal protein L6